MLVGAQRKENLALKDEQNSPAGLDTGHRDSEERSHVNQNNICGLSCKKYKMNKCSEKVREKLLETSKIVFNRPKLSKK